MNMIKILLKFFMMAALFFSATKSYAYDFEVDGIYYNIVSIEKNTCEVSTSNYSGHVTIPATVTYSSREFDVVGIGREAFLNCTNLLSLTIPESVISIGYQAFMNCSSITALTIPNSVTTLSVSAFEGCSNLTEIYLPNSLANIHNDAFKDCINLKTVELPNTLTRIASSLFDGCTSLSEITIPETVTSIGTFAFRNCTSLSSIEIPGNLSIIYSNAFDGCSSLKSVMIPNVSKIGSNAFVNCTSLSEFGFAADVNTTTYDWTDSDQEKTIYGNCPNLHKLIVFPSLNEYNKPYEEMIKTYHSWLDEIDIRELEVHSSFLSNTYSRNVTTKSENYNYSLILNSLETVKLNNAQCLSTYSNFDSARTYYWTFYFKYCNDLKSIICDLNPPVWSYTSADFTNSQYMNTCVYVPSEAVGTYKENNVWKIFWNIKSIDDFSTIVPNVADKDNCTPTFYLLNGLQIHSAPAHGIYIRKQGNIVTKVIK